MGERVQCLFYFYNSEKEQGENQLVPSLKALPSISKLMNTNLKMHGLMSSCYWVSAIF